MTHDRFRHRRWMLRTDSRRVLFSRNPSDLARFPADKAVRFMDDGGMIRVRHEDLTRTRRR